jgi:hypothetical protein
VARLSAKLCRIHVSHAAIRSCSKYQYIQKRGYTDEEKTTLGHRLAKIDGRINRKQFSRSQQLASAQQNPDGDKYQAEDKKTWKDEKKQNSDVRMRRPGEDKVIDPKSNYSQCATGGQNGANQ